MPLGDVRRHGNRRSPDLGRKPECLSLGKSRRGAVNRLHNVHPSLPDMQVSKMADFTHYALPAAQPGPGPLAPDPWPPYPACSLTFIRIPSRARVLSSELPP